VICEHNLIGVILRYRNQIITNRRQTKGELKDTVERFIEWLLHQVLQREVTRAIEMGAEQGAAGAAKIVLCGHSMGGLVVADALLAIQKMQTDDGPLWPRIIALLAFDTPVRNFHYPGSNGSLLNCHSSISVSWSAPRYVQEPS
jgi:pimeloyl-ACP methyl ester carboxylesterase